MKTITIQVTQQDIISGKRNSHGQNPLTLAVKRQSHYPAYSTPEVLSKQTSAGNWIDYTLPSKAQKFLSTFNAGKKVQPATFTLQS